MKKALITGISGQDGSYLAELLLNKGYEVHGIVRKVALDDPARRLSRIGHILDSVVIHGGSMESYPSMYRAVGEIMPDECYHLAAQSFVSYSFEDEFSTMLVNVDGTHHVLAALKDHKPDCRLYFAGSSEMFGLADETPQSETSRFHPRSTYGISKVAGYFLTQNYREAYGIHASSGIVYNHESPRRGQEFVTQKIATHAAMIKLGLRSELRLGNLEARRDWGHAKEYVGAMWMMLQQERPDDYVVATGQSHSVRDFAELAFSVLDLDYRDYVVVDPSFFRPADVNDLEGDSSKARRALGWQPEVTFEQLVEEMTLASLETLSEGCFPTSS